MAWTTEQIESAKNVGEVEKEIITSAVKGSLISLTNNFANDITRLVSQYIDAGAGCYFLEPIIRDVYNQVVEGKNSEIRDVMASRQQPTDECLNEVVEATDDCETTSEQKANSAE